MFPPQSPREVLASRRFAIPPERLALARARAARPRDTVAVAPSDAPDVLWAMSRGKPTPPGVVPMSPPTVRSAWAIFRQGCSNTTLEGLAPWRCGECLRAFLGVMFRAALRGRW